MERGGQGDGRKGMEQQEVEHMTTWQFYLFVGVLAVGLGIVYYALYQIAGEGDDH